MLLILRLRILVVLRWIVSWLIRCSIVKRGLAITLILNWLVLISLVRWKRSTCRVARRLSKNWGCCIINRDWYFLFFALLFRRWSISIVNNNRLSLIHIISSSFSSNAANYAQTETKSHAWIERNHSCTSCKIWGWCVVIAWVITNIIVISINKLRTTNLIVCWTIIAVCAILQITNFLLKLLGRIPWRNVW